MLNSQIKDFTSTPNILYVTQVPNCGVGGNQGQNLVKVVNLIPLGASTTSGTTTVTNQQIVNTRPTISVLNKPTTTTTTTITPRIVQLPNSETRPVIKLTRVAPKIINLSRPPASAPVNASPQVQTLIPINFPVNNNNNTAINIPEQQQQQPVINHLVPQSQLQPNQQISTTNSIDSLTFFDDDLPIDIHPKQFFEPTIVKDIEKPEQKPTKEKPQTIHQLILQQQQQQQQQIRPQRATITTLLSKQSYQKPQILQPQPLTQPKQQPIQQPPPQQVVKRPVNAFILWSQQERRKLNAGLTSASSERLGDISKQLGLKWGLMSQEEKLPYIIEAERHRQAHRIQYPDYRPQKSSTNSNGPRSKRSRRSVESSSVGTSSSNTTFSDCYSQPQASPYSTTSSSELANSTADIDDLDISNFDFDSADFETLINSFDVNQPVEASTTDFNSGCGSGSIVTPPVMIDLTCEELVENRYLNSDTTLKHYMPNCSSLALTPPDDDLYADIGRKKAQIRKTQSTNGTRRINGFLTSIKLTPVTGEKKLKPGHNQTTRVIQIRGDNAELKQITEMLLNKGPIRPGENLLNSIDAATLSALMAHVNRLGPATSIQSNYDDLDIGFDWEIDRSKLESASTIEPSISTLKNEPSEPSYAQIPNLTCLSAQLTDPKQSTYNYSSFDYAPPPLCSSNSGGEQAELNTNDLLFSDDDFKTLINSPIMFDDMPIMF